jgi:hypothetical protein
MGSRSHMDDPEYWRNRAKEMRHLAVQVSHLDHKKEILKIAEDSDRLAERAERGRCG